MKCTIQNIADHLGLSRNTVSKSLKKTVLRYLKIQEIWL